MKFLRTRSGVLPFLLLLFTVCAAADEALVAVATNFNGTAEKLATEYEAISEHRITITSGSTGGLYAQIRNGAPYDILLAADQERPLLLERSGDAIKGSRFTFAIGQLALWSAESGLVQADICATLMQQRIVALAIANPALAPYGVASREVLQSLHVWDKIKEKIVMGENVGQTRALIATGNAQAGFVALSQVIGHDESSENGYLRVPDDLHAPIRQDAVLLQHGKGNPAAIGFLSFLRSSEGRATIRSSGYGAD